jgi:hypothetical protein
MTVRLTCPRSARRARRSWKAPPATTAVLPLPCRTERGLFKGGDAVVDKPLARLPIHNKSTEPLEVVLEWYGRDYWLKPGESLVINTVGRTDGASPWPGTTRPNEPFDVEYYPGSIQVHFNGSEGWVTDLEGNELDCGHQRPEPAPQAPPHAPGSARYRLAGPGGDQHS